MKAVALLAVSLAALAGAARAQDRPAAQQIAGAVLPLPDSARGGATVLGYQNGRLTQLRAGHNGMICLADDPNQVGFQTSCYYRTLEPFMARGRSLRAAGITKRHAIDSVRLAEIKRGKIVMPKVPALLSSVFSQDSTFDPLAPAPKVTTLHVIYMPYATEASTGIPATPMKAGPWLMYAGTPWSHVMLP